MGGIHREQAWRCGHSSRDGRGGRRGRSRCGVCTEGRLTLGENPPQDGLQLEGRDLRILWASERASLRVPGGRVAIHGAIHVPWMPALPRSLHVHPHSPPRAAGGGGGPTPGLTQSQCDGTRGGRSPRSAWETGINSPLLPLRPRTGLPVGWSGPRPLRTGSAISPLPSHRVTGAKPIDEDRGWLFRGVVGRKRAGEPSSQRRPPWPRGFCKKREVQCPVGSGSPCPPPQYLCGNKG